MAFRSGQALGMAFQLRDDLIDYQLDVAESGKPRLQDIQNGIYTAPLLFAMREDKSIQQQLRAYIQSLRQKGWKSLQIGFLQRMLLPKQRN